MTLYKFKAFKLHMMNKKLLLTLSVFVFSAEIFAQAEGGVLFIDEAPECGPGILDSLRQPLESGEITIARSIGNLTFPAQFLLVLAANPCPCGKFSGRGRNCTCTSQQVRRYLGKLSGPLLDRIDLRVITRRNQHDLFAIIARRPQRFLCAFDVAGFQRLTALFLGKRGTAGEYPLTHAPARGIIAGNRCQVITLIHRHSNGAANGWVVEGGLQRVEAANAVSAIQ